VKEKEDKMKKIFLLTLMIAICLAIAVPAQTKDLEIGFVDILLVFNDYAKTKDYENIIEEKKNKKEEEAKLQEKKDEIIKMQDSLGLLKEQEKVEQAQKIEKAVAEYRNSESKIFNELKQESDERMKEILDDINKAIENHARKKGFDLILNKSGILYGIDAIDVTDAVLKDLNGSYKKK
jgi:outer membrane protein